MQPQTSILPKANPGGIEVEEIKNHPAEVVATEITKQVNEDLEKKRNSIIGN